MQTILVPVDGTAASLVAVRDVVAQARRGGIGTIHLLNVQPHLPGHAARFLSRRVIRDHQRDSATEALAAARRILDEAGLAYAAHLGVGKLAATIASVAEELRADAIVMASEGKGLIGSLLARLRVNRVMHSAQVPVFAVRAARRAPSAGTERLQTNYSA